MSSIAWTAGLIIVLAAWALSLLLGYEFASLFEYSTITIGVGSGLVLGAMDLAGPIHDFGQRGRSVSISFRRFLPLSGFWVAEIGINGHVLSIAVVVPVFIFVTSWFPISIPDFEGAGVFGVVASSS